MSKIFHSYISNFQFVTPDLLYGEYEKYFRTGLTTKKSSIYFIVKSPKMRWDLSSFHVRGNYHISADICIGKQRVPSSVDMAHWWFEMPLMQEKFKSKSHMAEYFMRRTQGWSQWLPGEWKYRVKTKLNEAATPQRMFIDCELMRNMNADGRSDMSITPYQAINLGVNSSCNFEIAYIGSSITSPFDRLLKHEKLAQIQAEKKDDEDILIYFMEAKTGLLEQHALPGVSIIANLPHGLSHRDETLLAEMMLINYFKPSYNEKHVERDIKHCDTVRRTLIAQGYEKTVAEVILEGPLGKIGSSATSRYGDHIVALELGSD